jgi:predicted methyltransferase
MKFIWIASIPVVLAGCGGGGHEAFIETPDLARIGDVRLWNVINTDPVVSTEEGRTVLRLAPRGGDGRGSNVGLALVEGRRFTEGTIDVDLRGNGASAPSFLGVAFGVTGPTTYEAVYFRPFRFAGDDAEARSHAVQYVAWPDHTWEQLRRRAQGAFEAAIDPAPDPASWFHAHVVVGARQVSVFVNGSTRPCLVVDRLRAPARGEAGLLVDSREGAFSNPRFAPVDSPSEVSSMPAAPAGWNDVVAAADRSQEDRALDAGRHPAETLTFLGVRPGMRVADLGAGPGYTTELLARAVGRTGVVYMQNEPTWLPSLADALRERFAHAAMAEPSVIQVERPFEAPLPPEASNLDLVVMNLVYHDVAATKTDRAAMNGHVFDALRPGGSYVVIDTSAPDGSGSAGTQTLHRIDENVVKTEVVGAGFRLADEGAFLRNPSDARDWNAAPDAATALGKRGTADRFALRFVKPLTTRPAVASPAAQAPAPAGSSVLDPKVSSVLEALSRFAG